MLHERNRFRWIRFGKPQGRCTSRIEIRSLHQPAGRWGSENAGSESRAGLFHQAGQTADGSAHRAHSSQRTGPSADAGGAAAEEAQSHQ